MNLYETEALTFDPERRGESTAADVFCLFFSFFSLFFFVLFTSGLIHVHGAFFYGESLSYGKRKTSKEGKNGLLCFIHFISEPVEALWSHEHFNVDQGKWGRRRLAIISPISRNA